MNLKKILDRNRDNIKRLIVSYDFMTALQLVADLIDIRNDIDKETKYHDFDTIHTSYTEEDETWFLWDIPIMFSNTLDDNALLELNDDQTVVIEGITPYKNK